MKQVSLDSIFEEEFVKGSGPQVMAPPPNGICPILLHAYFSYFGRGQKSMPTKKIVSLCGCGPGCSWYLKSGKGHKIPEIRCMLIFALMKLAEDSSYLENLEDLPR